MSLTFNATTCELLDGQNFAVVSTVNPDGGPQSSVVWVKRDGDTALIATKRGLRKERNLARDERVSLSIFDLADPYRYVEIRGRAEIIDEGGRALIDELANQYRGHDYPEDPPGTERVVIRIVPERITGFSA